MWNRQNNTDKAKPYEKSLLENLASPEGSFSTPKSFLPPNHPLFSALLHWEHSFLFPPRPHIPSTALCQGLPFLFLLRLPLLPRSLRRRVPPFLPPRHSSPLPPEPLFPTSSPKALSLYGFVGEQRCRSRREWLRDRQAPRYHRRYIALLKLFQSAPSVPLKPVPVQHSPPATTPGPKPPIPPHWRRTAPICRK